MWRSFWNPSVIIAADDHTVMRVRCAPRLSGWLQVASVENHKDRPASGHVNAGRCGVAFSDSRHGVAGDAVKTALNSPAEVEFFLTGGVDFLNGAQCTIDRCHRDKQFPGQNPEPEGRNAFITQVGVGFARNGFCPVLFCARCRFYGKLGTRLLPCDTRALPVCLCDFQLRCRHGVFFFCAPGVTFAAFPAPSFASRKPVSIKNVPAGRAAGLIVCRWAAGYAVAGGRDGFRLQPN